jgi:hypothetical protein
MPWLERGSGTWGVRAVVFKALIRKPQCERERLMDLAKQAAV